VKILIISRKAEKKRRQFQSRQMQRLGLEFEFLDAFEASDLSVEDCQAAANTWPSPTLREDIACFTSHRLAWKVIIERNEWTLILEDDAVLSSRFADAIRSIEARRDDWDCVYDLEFAPRPHILAKSAAWTDGMHRATRVFQNRVGSAGYVIGPRAAGKMLEDTKSYALLDAYFWHRGWLKAYQIEPTPVVQMQFLEGIPDNSAFVRKSIDREYLPQSELRRKLMRLRLEGIKARNLVRGWLGGETRPLQIDRASFAADLDIRQPAVSVSP
jgi:glycosyl transferase family 25